MEEDTSIYKAIIIALILGIIIVIITLIIARPKPETFTELYFNEHEELPKYIKLSKQYNYSFSLANHEKIQTQYNYTITRELYKFNYSCERPNLYLEETNISEYNKFVKKESDVLTRTSKTNDQRLLVKDKEYSLSYNYIARDGIGQIVTRFNDLEGNEKYALIINEDKQVAYFSRNYDINKSVYGEELINIQQGELHNVNIFVSYGNIILKIDNQTIFNNSIDDYSVGFFTFETTKTYAEFSNIILNRPGQKQNINLIFADQKYTTAPLEEKKTDKTIQLYATNEEQNLFTYYITNTSFAFDSYTMEFAFRLYKGNKIEVGIENDYGIQFNRESNQLTINNQTFDAPERSNKTQVHRLKIIVNKDEAEIIFDNEQINRTFTIKNSPGKKPFINLWDSKASIQLLTAKNNKQPILIKYNIPNLNQDIKYAALPGIKLLNETNNIEEENITAEDQKISNEQKEIIMDLFESRKIEWNNYRTKLVYIDPDKNGTVILNFNDIDNDLYTIIIDDKKNTVEISYNYGENFERVIRKIQLNNQITHLLIMDVNKNELEITLDNKVLLRKVIDKASNGILLVDYSDSIKIQRLDVENRESNEVKVYTTTTTTCKPQLIKTYTTKRTATLDDMETKTFYSTLSYDLYPDFDISKVQISLDNGQEIHFWTVRT